MLRLGGGTHFLVLRSTPGFSGHLVEITGQFDRTLADWEPGSRISPVYPLVIGEVETPIPRLSDVQTRWLLFLGPLHPGLVQFTKHQEVFLSLGLFNVVVFCDHLEQVAETEEFARTHGVPSEKWELAGNNLRSITYPTSRTAPPELPERITRPLAVEPPAIKPTVREYSALMASTLSRARLFCPTAVPDLLQFDKVFRELLALTTDLVSRHGQLVLTNAALSRYSSQTFAGTSPILERECHFWTHSLLGVGIASIALQQIRKSIDTAMDGARITDRLLNLRNVGPNSRPLLGLPTHDEFWLRDHLFASTPEYRVPSSVPAEEEALPQITCFSGRDGFRSTEFSLSAPLEVITGCNTTSWTLQTITHEMSHSIVMGVLAALLPTPNREAEVRRVFRVMGGTDPATSLLDQVQALLAFAVWKTTVTDPVSRDVSATEFAEHLRANAHEANEILTHIVDFLYFYRQDASRYVESIWASWGVIPNIEDRIEDYIVRSLCAVHANHLRREDAAAITVEEVQGCLERARDRFPAALYIPRAVEELRHRREYYLRRLRACTRLVQFAKSFMYSAQAARLFMAESVAVGGAATYEFEPFTFSDERIGNPLRFVDENTGDKQPEHRQALWMLVQLAFAESS